MRSRSLLGQLSQNFIFRSKRLVRMDFSVALTLGPYFCRGENDDDHYENQEV